MKKFYTFPIKLKLLAEYLMPELNDKEWDMAHTAGL
jgi:hypothetical protein